VVECKQLKQNADAELAFLCIRPLPSYDAVRCSFTGRAEESPATFMSMACCAKDVDERQVLGISPIKCLIFTLRRQKMLDMSKNACRESVWHRCSIASGVQHRTVWHALS